MREIKFRAWDKKRKEMSGAPNYQLSFDGLLCWQFGYESNLLDQDNFDVMRYIGVKDKNGKEVYDGDIVRSHDWCDVCWNKSVKREVIEVIEWDSDMELSHARGSCAGFYYPETEFEVIGNIYENPELLDNK